MREPPLPGGSSRERGLGVRAQETYNATTLKKNTNNRSREARDRARELRQQMGVTESIVWGLLRGRVTGYKFRRQHPVGRYFLDFYCREASLAVELEGEQHRDQTAYDAERDAWLESRGILVIRVPTLDFFEGEGVKAVAWMREVEEACAARTRPLPQPPLQ